MYDLILACACQPAADKFSSVLKLVGAFLLVPFLIVGIVYLVIRQVAQPHES
jgi:preprotein translocase subunit Sss1